MDLIAAAATLQKFGGTKLTQQVSRIESSLVGMNFDECANTISRWGVNNDVLVAAALLKQAAGQINVVIHALGILSCLPHLLEPDEVIEYVSLGAGNSGRHFDLETSKRVAEFKFISWKGGPESIRQNSIFKDFYFLAEYETTKRKYLYLLGAEYPMKFFNGGRSLSSVLKDAKFNAQFQDRLRGQYSKVREYYAARKDRVSIEDLSQYLPELVIEYSKE
jgi:hypothetical protein